MNPQRPHSPSPARAFTLVEMLAVMAVIGILLVTAVNLLGDSRSQARRTATDVITGMIEQARTSAITTRSHVILAIAEPGDLPNDDTRCRIGLFRVSEWPDDLQGEIPAKLIQRWRPLENGVVLAPGSDTQEAGATLENPLDSTQLQIRDETRSKPKQIEVHAIVFNPRGGMAFPEGSSPAELRIAEGTYRSGKAVPVRRGTPPTIAENRLKIGRIIARPYRSN